MQDHACNGPVLEKEFDAGVSEIYCESDTLNGEIITY